MIQELRLGGVRGSGMVGWVLALASTGLAELIEHPKTQSVLRNLVGLVSVPPGLKLCIPGVQILRSTDVKQENLKVKVG